MEESDCDGNLESDPFQPEPEPTRNSTNNGQPQKDTLTVKVNLRHKISDASSTDDLSDIEEEVAATGKCKNCRRSRACCITLYLWIVLFFIGSLAGIVVVGIVVVKPFLLAEEFLVSPCTAVTSDFGEELRCSCGKRCNSGYSCLQVWVTLDDNADNKVLLFDDEATLSHECSYYPPCKSSKMANEKAVRDYEHMYGQPGKKFSCLYNPKNPTEVIRTRRFHLNHVIHGMVWSSLVFILSLVILIVAIRKKGCDFL